MAVKLNQHDLEFILKQIKIAEANSTAHSGENAVPLLEVRVNAQGEYGAEGTPALSQPHLPYGLRTVDGSYNNLIPGRELWGASDQIMPRMLQPNWNDEEDEGSIDINGPQAPGGEVTNTDYGQSGHVIDTDPRVITNLISDQTLNNPAAIMAALQHAEYDGDLLAAVNAIRTAYKAYVAAAQPLAEAAIVGITDPVERKAAVEAAIEPLRAELHESLTSEYGFEMEGNSIVLPNVAPDEGLSAPFNGWMTFFGQFFDHGLDLIHKGDNGTIFVPLAADDPLVTHGPDGIAESGDEVPAHLAWMAVTRLKPEAGPGADGVIGTADDTMEAKNKTTPFVDQNQTYTSHPSHQVFLREYTMVDGKPVATGRLLNGADGGLATWADVKLQAAEKLGIQLTDYDIIGVPLLRTDLYGEFIRDANGFPQVIYNIGPDGIPNTDDDLAASGNPDVPLNLRTLNNNLGPVRTSHQFLDDIAHNANPFGTVNGQPAILQPDINTETDPLGNPIPNNPDLAPAYDNELLDRHFITGDGRGNENIGLTTVHHVFHSEHNRQVADVKKQVLEIASSGKAADIAFLNEWLAVDVTAVPTTPEGIAALQWDGERLFQTARFATEMQYQHLVFEEFGRKVQPNIDLFIFNTITDVNPAIFAEFAHTVYRFGHSMLTDHLKLLPLSEGNDRDENGNLILDANGNPLAAGVPLGPDGRPIAVADWGIDVGLIEAFLNPVLYNHDGGISAEQAAGAIARGMTYVHGNAIDEFVVESLRNNLLGLPLDLAAINIARGRDAGVPSLNEAREQLYAASNSSWLKPYESWADFAANLKTPASIINFLAAYGTHPLLLAADTLEEKRDVAMDLLGLGGSTGTEAVTLTNASFEATSLASGAPGVVTDPPGNYTQTAPSGWTLTGTGGLFAPAAGIVDPAGRDGTNVAWLGQDAVLSQATGQMLVEGASYRLRLDIGDRTDMAWPGGEARLVASNGTVLATQALTAPADGGWSTITLQTASITADLAGLGLTIVIQQTGGSANQILVDDVSLEVVRPNLAPDRLDFLNSTGAWANQETGLNNVDLWIGGLAEKIMPFGGMLGSTFNAVFELQLENLQEGDRFYYLSRTQGLNLLNELENNAFSKMIMANTDLTQPGPDGIRGTDDDIVTHHIGVDSFAKYDGVLEVDLSRQIAADAQGSDPFLNAIRAKVQRDDPSTGAVETNYLRFTGGEHMVMGGTAQADTIIGGDGDDGIWGGAGDDRIESGHGVDLVVAGAGDDIITDTGDTGDFLKGESGDDVIANSNGLDVLMGGDGKDVFLVGVDATEVFGGEGDDFILGGLDHDFILGNEGDDWMEGGDGFDVLNGDNSELFFNSTILGHDVLIAGENENDFDAESGDDIMVQGESVMRNEGMFGFDWAIYKGSEVAADADMRIPFFTTVADDILRDRFDQTEALSGWKHNDILRGDDRGSTEEIEVEFSMANHELSWAGVDRIAGLQELLGLDDADRPTDPNVDLEKAVAWSAGNLLIGGDGSDLIEGRGADDFIHGDAWLNVRIRIVGVDDEGKALANDGVNEIATIDTLKHVFQPGDVDSQGEPVPAAWHGKSMSELLLARVIKPSQMHIVREILYDEDPSSDTDTAIFAGNRDWYEITHLDDGSVRVARREMEEVDPAIDEGTDTLVGIERILFADGIYTIRQTANYDPTGRLTITGLPATEGEELTVDASAIRDLNNPNGMVDPGSITFRWQIERNDGTGDYIDIPGSSGNTFTPGADHVGLRIRVLGTYNDGGGVIEVVMSQPTDPVENVDGDPIGDVLLSDMSPTEGQELTATAAFDDPDGITDAFEEGLLTYQWQYAASPDAQDDEWTDVPAELGGNARTFTPGPAQVGMYLRMVIDYTDDGGTPGRVVSAPTGIVGNFINSNESAINAGAGGDNRTNAGDDWVLGGASNQTISGGDGNDYVFAGGGNDTVNGDAGNDTLNGGAGNDAVNGGVGNDRIIHTVGEGADTANGGVGLDTFRIEGSATSPNDQITIVMTDGVISQAGGATVSNFEAFETEAGAGTDTLVYSTDDDVSVNLLNGAATGMSFIRGVENVTSGGGNDTLIGNVLSNTFDGDSGDDSLRGGFGDDSLMGGAGNDSLYGEDGDDVLDGGLGNDRIDGGSGVDTASYASATAGVTVSLLGEIPAPGQPRKAPFEEQNTGGAGLDRLIGIENLTGSSFNDLLEGDAGANVLDGGSGADTLRGGAGNDTYIVNNVSGSGEPGSDLVVEEANEGIDTVIVTDTVPTYTLGANLENLTALGNADGVLALTGNGLGNVITGGEGTDNISGLGGDDFLVKTAGGDTLDGGAGTDTLVLANPVTSYLFAHNGTNPTVGDLDGSDVSTLIGIEKVRIAGVDYNFAAGTNGANGTSANRFTGGSGADLVLGFEGNDFLGAGSSNDILIGGGGNDNISAGAGNDVLIGGSGNDTLNGGDGIDTADYSQSSGAVNVNRQADTASGGHAQGDSLDSIENVIGSNFNDTITGNGSANELVGGGGSDTLSGGGGADTLRGGAGNDSLSGGDQDDVLEGGAGSDILNGGAGIDIAVFEGSASEYSFTVNNSGVLTTVTRLGVNNDTNTLVGIERIRFGDGTEYAIVNNAGTVNPNQTSIIVGTGNADTITGSNLNDVIIGGPGNDTLNGYDVGDEDATNAAQRDDDIFIWHVGDGMDLINGGGEAADGDGDHFVIVGNTEAETYRIYTYDEAVARIGFAGSDETEIVVTRQVTGGDEEIIAELTEIEEIIINGVGVSGNVEDGNDAYEMYGDFSVTTNLRPDTLTIIGSEGNDTVNISGLRSAHRIVFKTMGGNDTIIGTLRPQDVIELEAGKTIDDYAVTTNEDGSTTIASPTHSVTFRSSGGLPQFGSGGDEEDDEDEGDNGSGSQDEEDDGSGNEGGNGSEDDDDSGSGSGDEDEEDEDEDDDAGAPQQPSPVNGAPILGTAQADALVGTSAGETIFGMDGDDAMLGGGGADVLNGAAGNDYLAGEAGRDLLFGGDGDDVALGGDDTDMLYGEGGNDRLLGEAGDDLIDGGLGNDTVYGGLGNDTFVASVGDGNDLYHGDELGGGAGNDTLDMAAITANITANLGANGGSGSVSSAQTGHDVLRGVENIVTGSGNDVITASSAVNVIDGGGGQDVFRFLSTGDADGDTILGFEPGDRIDLSAVDANRDAAGSQSFTLSNGGFSGPAQLVISHESRDDGDYTVISGNTTGADAAEFKISIKGTHTLDASDFVFS